MCGDSLLLELEAPDRPHRLKSVARREPVLDQEPVDRSNHNGSGVRNGLIRQEFASTRGPPCAGLESPGTPHWIHGSTEIGTSCHGMIVVPALCSGEPACFEPWVV